MPRFLASVRTSLPDRVRSAAGRRRALLSRRAAPSDRPSPRVAALVLTAVLVLLATAALGVTELGRPSDPRTGDAAGLPGSLPGLTPSVTPTAPVAAPSATAKATGRASSTTAAAAEPAAGAAGAPVQTQPCSATTGSVKPVLEGLLSLNRATPMPSPVPMAGWSITIPWSDLQPSAGGAIVHPNAIDKAIDQMEDRSGGGPCRYGVKVRVLAGTSAPEWAKSLGGAPLKMTMAGEHLTGTVPRFWSARFGDAYADLQDKLAADYDGIVGIRETVISRCSTFYAEPMMRQVDEAANLATLHAAGFTQSADEACLRAQTDAHRVWRLTNSSLALNPYTPVTTTSTGAVASTRPGGDVGLPIAMGSYCRSVLGRRCIIANNSIRWPPLSDNPNGLFHRMKTLGGPFEFQAAAPSRIGDPVRTIQYAVDFGAGSVELTPSLITGNVSGLTPVARDLADS